MTRIRRWASTGLCLVALTGPAQGYRPTERGTGAVASPGATALTDRQLAAASESAQPLGDLASLTQRAEAGELAAQFELGWNHYEGTGAPKDHDAAARWLRRAADRGHLTAQVRLGNLYEWGHGVPENPQIAAAWYQKAANGGLSQGHFALGKLHLDGVGMPRDAAKAATAFRRAADGGFPMGAFVLAQLHRTGEGVSQDHVDAYAWLLVATASQGVPPFIAGLRDEVAATLTPDEIARAVRLAGERRPRAGSPSTGSRAAEPPRLAGHWTINTELSGPTNGSIPDAVEGRGGGAGGFGGGRGGSGSGRGGPGGFGGGGRPGGNRPTDEELERHRALIQEVLTLPRRFTLEESEASVTLLEPDGVTRTYHTNGKGEKHQATNGVVETKTRRADASLVMQIKAGRLTLTRTFAIRTADGLRRLEVATTVKGAPDTDRRVVVYDAQE